MQLEVIEIKTCVRAMMMNDEEDLQSADMSIPQRHAHCAFKKKKKKSHWCSVRANLILGEQVGLQVFLKSFLGIMLSQSNGQTVPQCGCSIEKRSDSEVFFVVSSVDTGNAKTGLGGGPQMTLWKLAGY